MGNSSKLRRVQAFKRSAKVIDILKFGNGKEELIKKGLY
jgi:hypothetical protein